MGTLGFWAMNARPRVGYARRARRRILKIEKLEEIS